MHENGLYMKGWDMKRQDSFFKPCTNGAQIGSPTPSSLLSRDGPEAGHVPSGTAVVLCKFDIFEYDSLFDIEA